MGQIQLVKNADLLKVNGFDLLCGNRKNIHTVSICGVPGFSPVAEIFDKCFSLWDPIDNFDNDRLRAIDNQEVTSYPEEKYTIIPAGSIYNRILKKENIKKFYSSLSKINDLYQTEIMVIDVCMVDNINDVLDKLKEEGIKILNNSKSLKNILICNTRYSEIIYI